jgi:hypothetical protein
MIRPIWLVLSLALHAGLFFLVVSDPGTPSPEMGPPPQAMRAVPLSPQSDAPSPEQAATEPPPPPPAPAAAQAQGPPAASPGAPAPRPEHAGPELPPDMAVISPVKRNMHLPPPVHVGQGQIKTGKVTSMTLRRMAGYDFTLDEFCGHYEVNGEPGRFVDVVRHAAVPEALVLRDSATGMVRVLRRFSTFIFTYGPSFSQDEPVEGSVTFLARKDFEQIADVDERSRLLWQGDHPPARVAVRLDGATPPAAAAFGPPAP